MRLRSSAPPIRKDPRSGVFVVWLDTPHGRRRISTGERSYERATAVCDEAMIAKLQMAARAGVLNANAISVLTTGRRFTTADVAEAWREEAAMDLAPDTLNNYALVIFAFLANDRIGKKPIAMVTRQPLDVFVNAKDASEGTRQLRLSALRSFFGFANNAAYCPGNVAQLVTVRQRDLTFSQREKFPRVAITHEEYSAIMASEKVVGFYRWATALSYWLGLRIRDVACLEWASIQEDKGLVIVHTQKSGKRVALPLDNPLIGSGDVKLIIREMREFMEDDARHPVYCFPKERELALSVTKRAIFSVYFARILRRLKIAGRGKCFHSLRYAFCQRLAAAGVTVEQIGVLVGHSSPDTTAIYLGQK